MDPTSPEINLPHQCRDVSAGHRTSKRNVLVLVGPTASGKTTVALTLARVLDGEIISADSRQVYKFLDIGTAKPNLEERALAKHYFVDELTPDREFSAGRFGVRGREIIKEIFHRGKTPLVVGGSGLYVTSLIDGLFEGPGADHEFRAALEARVAAGDIASLIDELRKIDPVTAEKLDPTKPRRVIRALEVYHLTGTPISRHHETQQPVVDITPVFFGLAWDRATLYRRVEERCDQMITAGLLGEVEQLETLGYGSSLNALKTVGYAEAFSYRRGEISYREFVNLFKQNSRRYAKRQLTWFRRDPRIHWIRLGEEADLHGAGEKIAGLFHRSMRSLYGW